MKRIFALALTCFLLTFGIYSAQAAETGMYVNNIYLNRNFNTVGRFDMLPILDIAGELGFGCDYDGSQFRLYNDETTYTFTMGSADVYSHDGVWFGLDVVPQILDGSVMIPANFLIYNMGTSYTWDELTQTLFIASDRTYQWLIQTPEYREGKKLLNTQTAVQGWWYNDDYDIYDLYFAPDGRAYLLNTSEGVRGRYRVTAPNIIEVSYEPHTWFGDGELEYIDAFTTTYRLENGGKALTDMDARAEGYTFTYKRGSSGIDYSAFIEGY